MFLSKDIVVHYYPRATLPALARQYFKYGSGRARSLLKHRTLPSLRPTLPFAMVMAACASLQTACGVLQVLGGSPSLGNLTTTGSGSVCVQAKGCVTVQSGSAVE